VLAGSCWTKVHELANERVGEIYVISVDPAFQGHGLGQLLVRQGLDTLRRKGVKKAMLFVDDKNTGAKSMYEELGFKVKRTDALALFPKP
jgi:mycothiol synthase